MSHAPSRKRRGRRGALAAAAVAVAVVAVLAATLSAGSAETPSSDLEAGGPIGVFPAPGTSSASPRTELSFRGVGADGLEGIEVAGARTGPRTGRVVAHSDGRGASLVFDRPFGGREEVSVRTTLDVVGARDGDFTFRTARRPEEGLGSNRPPPPDLLREYSAQEGRVPEGAAPRFRSRPDLRPPEIEMNRRGGEGTAEGEVLISPKKVFGARKRAGLQAGAMVLDERGEPVWFAPSRGNTVNDLRVQAFRGKPVLSLWQGRQVLGSGEGEFLLLDERYQPVARVRAGNGYRFDFHEARITPEGTALGLVYSPVDHDLRSVGGPRDGRVVDAVVQEIDIATGRVLFEWHSLGNVALDESYGRSPASRGSPYDYFHVNSVDVDTDGDLLVSARDTHAVYKLDRRTGRVLWRLGGKRSDFRMGRAERFAWQHDAQRQPDGTIRIFDNAAAPKVRDASRVIALALDEEQRTARLVDSIEHPRGLLAGTQGNAQLLDNGNLFVGWGSQGYFSEFSSDGRMLFDGRVARGNDTYRAYRSPWTGRPTSRPAVAGARAGDGTRVYASWNGATEVVAWQVLAGDGADALRPAGGPARRTGFETTVRVDGRPRYVAVRALDGQGAVLGESPARRVEG